MNIDIYNFLKDLLFYIEEKYKKANYFSHQTLLEFISVDITNKTKPQIALKKLKNATSENLCSLYPNVINYFGFQNSKDVSSKIFKAPKKIGKKFYRTSLYYDEYNLYQTIKSYPKQDKFYIEFQIMVMGRIPILGLSTDFRSKHDANSFYIFYNFPILKLNYVEDFIPEYLINEKISIFCLFRIRDEPEPQLKDYFKLINYLHSKQDSKLVIRLHKEERESLIYEKILKSEYYCNNYKDYLGQEYIDIYINFNPKDILNLNHAV